MVEPFNSDLPINELTRLNYQDLLNRYAECHERQTTMDFHHQLKGAILDAVDDGLIDRDPTRKAIIKGKVPRPKKAKFLNQFELHKPLSELDIPGSLNWDWFILLIAKTRMRFSEALAMRFGEIPHGSSGETGSKLSFVLDTALTLAGADRIDNDYMDEKFEKWVRALQEHADPAALKLVKNELHQSYADLPKAKQDIAELVLHDLESRILKFDIRKTFRDYLEEYEENLSDTKLNLFAKKLGVDSGLLKSYTNAGYTSENLNDYGRFKKLKDSVDNVRATETLSEMEGRHLSRGGKHPER